MNNDLYLQWKHSRNFYTTATAHNYTLNTRSIQYVNWDISEPLQGTGPVAKSSNRQWLDKRVEEMRVKL